MMQPTDFRSRARTVRDAARKQLLKLREERMQHKGLRLPLAEKPTIPAEEPEIPEAIETPELEVHEVEVEPEVAAEAPVEPAIEPAAEAEPAPVAKPKTAKRKAPAKAQTRVARKSAPVIAEDTPEDRSIRRAALAEMFDEPQDVEADSAAEFPLDEILAAGPLPNEESAIARQSG